VRVLAAPEGRFGGAGVLGSKRVTGLAE